LLVADNAYAEVVADTEVVADDAAEVVANAEVVADGAAEVVTDVAHAEVVANAEVVADAPVVLLQPNSASTESKKAS
jgi:hypothetical protein